METVHDSILHIDIYFYTDDLKNGTSIPNPIRSKRHIEISSPKTIIVMYKLVCTLPEMFFVSNQQDLNIAIPQKCKKNACSKVRRFFID